MTLVIAEAKQHHSNGFRLLAAGSYAKAREQFLKAIEKDQNWGSPHLGLGQTFFFAKKPNFNKAVQSFRRAIELSPDSVEGYNWLGLAQQQNGELNHAVQSFERAIRLAPTDARPLVSLGACLTRLKQYTLAISHLRRAIELKPHYAEASAHLFLADALKESGQIDAACKEWQMVLKMPTEYPEYDEAKKEADQLLERHCASRPTKQRSKRRT